VPRNPKVGKKNQDRRSKAITTSGRPRRGRPKICIFCSERATWVDYKDVGLLKRFTSDRGRIKARGATGTCAQHQRDVTIAIKTARELALLPYAVRTMGGDARSSRGGDRRGSGSGPTAGSGSDRVSPDAADRAEDSDSPSSVEVEDGPNAATDNNVSSLGS
jgi:small subunit ribosomal protein S18